MRTSAPARARATSMSIAAGGVKPALCDGSRGVKRSAERDGSRGVKRSAERDGSGGMKRPALCDGSGVSGYDGKGRPGGAMCVYCNGGPDCEKCSPKFLHCPNCGEKMSLYLPSCLKCGTTFTDEMKEQAREQWRVRASSGSSEKS